MLQITVDNDYYTNDRICGFASKLKSIMKTNDSALITLKWYIDIKNIDLGWGLTYEEVNNCLLISNKEGRILTIKFDL